MKKKLIVLMAMLTLVLLAAVPALAQEGTVQDGAQDKEGTVQEGPRAQKG